MPRALLNDEVRVAFLARTSTEDQQDPRQSIIRQLTNSKNASPPSWIITTHFFDVESGRLDLDERGLGQGYERFDIPVPRDGGIADLLGEASRRDRRFDVVMCENIARVARLAFAGISVERELEQVDVPLFASNEPLTLSGSRAQRVLQRPATLRLPSGNRPASQSRQGRERQDQVSPRTGRDPRSSRGAWTRSAVYNILRNPKYTGYQVFNRRATTSKRGRVNEPYKWVWSPNPVHEPLISKWLFDEINGDRTKSRGSRDGDTLNSAT